ncbi:type VI immunity family protein [Collimonas silvisoli]|uniref:type VI immunity family protein n=1 Tax=Collimonas silvisoli TaxID=2825884 RepID=UPI001B8BA1F3|nr:type VI immunity family protein [Collimonas silvisoli]
MTEAEFFDTFDAERWSLTFMDEEDTTQPVQQVGVVAIFHLVDAYLPIRRKHIAEAIALYDQHFGSKLQGGYRGEMGMRIQPYSRKTFTDCFEHITAENPMNAVEFKWMSRPSFGHVSDYMFGVYSPAGWMEKIHKVTTTVRFYLPVEELRGEGRQRVERLLLDMCQILRPLHGAAGLAIQECHEWEDFQYVEYEVAWAYRGLDVCVPISSPSWRDGYIHLNWYTFLAHHWLAKLGTEEQLRAKFADERIAILPYQWGSIIRAGDWPALGKAGADPRPELYAKVNDVIKPLRVNHIGSLHYGSIAGEIRFNPRTSNLWLRRFDRPEDVQAVLKTTPAHGKSKSSQESERYVVRIYSGTPCPWPGDWRCEQASHLGTRFFQAGDVMPDLGDKRVTWRLVKPL